jgi:hypothetical protein
MACGHLDPPWPHSDQCLSDQFNITKTLKTTSSPSRDTKHNRRNKYLIESHLLKTEKAPLRSRRNNSFQLCGQPVPWPMRLIAALSLRRPEYAPRSVHVGFVLDEVALGQVSHRVLRFFLSIKFRHGFPCSCITWVMNNRPVGVRSLET